MISDSPYRITGFHFPLLPSYDQVYNLFIFP